MFLLVTEGLCWARTSERQTSRLRRKYLSAVLRQDASFHDKANGAATAYQIVSSISADTLAIQSVLSEKVHTFITSLLPNLLLVKISDASINIFIK